MARSVHSPAATRPRERRARRSPGGPERSSAPAPPRPSQAAPPRRRAAARAGRLELPGRPATGGLSRGAPGSPHPLPPPGRPWSRGEGGKGLPRRAGGRERGLRHPSRSVTAAATTTRAVLLLPTCRKDTEHARTETTSGRHASRKF
ncbi:translation initiation factor IF-2-like [Leopardus geoffroyi]|uniref:translation initiation factor IF-2-like n=1 Tax=Leopardus geoffroyi TaxID=46844 RepID=UPI001E25F87A|nr:translation initiation factor IF-2-like [Leopardus geoffroyi]